MFGISSRGLVLLRSIIKRYASRLRLLRETLVAAAEGLEKSLWNSDWTRKRRRRRRVWRM